MQVPLALNAVQTSLLFCVPPMLLKLFKLSAEWWWWQWWRGGERIHFFRISAALIHCSCGRAQHVWMNEAKGQSLDSVWNLL